MSFFSKLWSFFKPVARVFVSSLADNIAKNGGPVLIQAALDGVAAAEMSGGSSSDKWNKAKDVVIAKLKANGIPVVNSAVNGAIEAALADYKKNQ